MGFFELVIQSEQEIEMDEISFYKLLIMLYEEIKDYEIKVRHEFLFGNMFVRAVLISDYHKNDQYILTKGVSKSPGYAWLNIPTTFTVRNTINESHNYVHTLSTVKKHVSWLSSPLIPSKTDLDHRMTE
jgi:hypothetical protein